MALEQGTDTEIALNVTRTRVTVLVFNLTIIAFMFSLMKENGGSVEHVSTAHLTTFIALFAGFCLTILGLFWLLRSQNLDSEGLSRIRPFVLGAITTYLALSHTITAVLHEYLLGVERVSEATSPGVAARAQNLIWHDALGDTALLILFVMAGGVWILTTYVGPLSVAFSSKVRAGGRWMLAGYYFALQIPIYWVYARGWQLQHIPADQSTNSLSLFAFQFLQPLLWWR